MVVIKNKHRTHPRDLFLNPFFGAEYMHILDVRQDYFSASKRRENRCARRGLLEVRRPKRGRRAALGDSRRNFFQNFDSYRTRSRSIACNYIKL